MKKINETATIGDLIDSSLFAATLKSSKMRFVVRHSMIFSFWEEIVGKKFANFTKPYAIKYSTLYVSAKSPVIAQELTLHKNMLIKKINSYSMPLDVEIKNISFNCKNFETLTSSEAASCEVEDKPVWIEEKDLLGVEADKEEILEIEKHVQKIKLLNEEQKKKLISKITAAKKAKVIQSTPLKE